MHLKTILSIDYLANSIADLIDLLSIKNVDTSYGDTHIEYHHKDRKGFISHLGTTIAEMRYVEGEMTFNIIKPIVVVNEYTLNRELSTLKSEIGECF